MQKKSNEIPFIPKLLEKLEIRGHIVSVDAMGTQRAIAKKIRDKEADYLMALKRNQGSLHDEVIDQFHFATTQIAKEKSKKWNGLCSLVMVELESYNMAAKKTTRQQRFYRRLSKPIQRTKNPCP